MSLISNHSNKISHPKREGGGASKKFNKPMIQGEWVQADKYEKMITLNI